MSEYTPEEGEVWGAYKFWLQQWSDKTVEEITAEFNRFVEDIKTQERLRIFNELNRVTLVDDDRGGIQYERHNIIVDHSIQDNGHTLKLFIKGN